MAVGCGSDLMDVFVPCEVFSTMKLDQSDGRGTDQLCSYILRRSGRWRCLRLVHVPALTDSSWYMSKTTSILWYFAPILNTVLAKMLAYSPNVLMSGDFQSAVTSAWLSMSRQLGSSSITVAGFALCCVHMFANTALLVECRLPLFIAKDSGTAMSSCWVWIFEVYLPPFSTSCYESL